MIADRPLRTPAEVRARAQEWYDRQIAALKLAHGDHDDLAQWMDECCERTGESRATDLYASFSQWKKDRGEHAPSQTVWGGHLTTIAGIEKRRSNGWRYSGIHLNEREMGLLSGRRF